MKSYHREKLHPSSCFPANPPEFNMRNHLLIRIASSRTRFKNVRVTFIGVNTTTYSSIAAILVSQIAESIECINIFDICSKVDVKTNLNDLQLISLFKKRSIQLNYVQSYWETRDSSIVIINVQHHRLDESLSKWTQMNAELVEDIVRQVCIHSPQAILIVCTQPNELMTYVASSVSRFPRERIFGLGASIDTAYAHRTIAENLKNLNGSINGYFIIGEANASISTKNLTIQGIPCSEIYTKSSFYTTEKVKSDVQSKRQATKKEWDLITMLKNKQTIYTNPSRRIHHKTMINYLVQKTSPSCPTIEQPSPTINLSLSTKPRSNWTEALLITRILQALINDSDFQSNFTVDLSSIVPNSRPIFLHYPTIIGATNGAIKYLVPLSTLERSSLVPYEKRQSKLGFCSSNQTIS